MVRFLSTIALHVSAWAFRTLLVVTILLAVLNITVSNRLDIKFALLETKSYETFIPSLLRSAAKANQDVDSIPLDNPEVMAIINRVFPPELLRSEAEKVIDAFYDWFEGISPEVEFTVDFTDQKVELANELSTYAFNRLAFLPPCQSQPQQVNPFTIECRPRDFDIIREQAAYEQALATSDTFLSVTRFSEANLPKNTEGKTLPQQLSFAPILYDIIVDAPWFSAGMTVLAALVYYGLHRKKRLALQTIGTTFVGVGASLLVFPVLYSYVLPKITSSLTLEFSGGDENVFNNAVNYITKAFDTMLILIGVQVFIVGLSIVLLERASRPKNKYKQVDKKAGVVSSFPPSKRSRGTGAFAVDKIPMQSSEVSVTKRPKSKDINKKYRTIRQKVKKGLVEK